MIDDLSRIMSSFKEVFLDYSAAMQMAKNGHYQSFLHNLSEAKGKVIVGASFRLVDECVINESFISNKKNNLRDADLYSQLVESGILEESNHTSVISFLSEFENAKHACLFVSRRSFAIKRIRDSGIYGAFSVCVVSGETYTYYANLTECLHGEDPEVIHPISLSSDYLGLDIHCNVGDNVYTENGDVVVLSDKISTGAEGIVFRTSDPKWVAKVYHVGVITPLRWRKLIRMTKIGISAKGICWPETLLYTFNKEPVGFLMSVAQGYTLGTVFDGPDAIGEHFPEWDRKSVVMATCQILEKIIYLQLHGVLIGDIQLKNMMIKDPNNVFLIDMDSVQIEDMPCPVGTEDYTAPELWEYSFATQLRRPIHEDYSCGILVFSLLFCGQHPYAQRLGRETLREEILAKSFPYSMKKAVSLVPIGGYDKIWDAIPEEMRKMFTDAFSEGKRYEPVEWYSALVDYLTMLTNHAFDNDQSYRLFPYTDHLVKPEEKKNPKYKKSIKDATIPSLCSLDNESLHNQPTAQKVLYNSVEKTNRADDLCKGLDVPAADKYSAVSQKSKMGTENSNQQWMADFSLGKSQSKKTWKHTFCEKVAEIFNRNRSLYITIVFLICVFLILLLALVLGLGG